ncbi:RabGAP TBC [Pisolithus croceorrhizus]|nr:RabGAP TBC [Pisolithus croceorrhizus]KAI6169637.1 RabGAP TBC [Pisolithus thermaeus]
MHSSAPRSPLAANEQASGAPTDIQAAADAHRQREVRWMALLPAVSPSQARKNKKVKRLLQDGVPSSLRYLVWCHLTDSKARALPGVYTKLGKRPHVPAFSEIEKDAIRCFPDQPQLHNTNGPIVSLLQAYLSMVPDIQYSSALTSIAGHLLLLAPEEDAFWIFASVMDAHLRSYFSTSTIQIEVDAALLSKAVEFNDPALHKKLYVSLQMAPASITRPWFSSLFVGTLPVDHLHRIWDIFLYEGMPFLFRVGLAVIHCVRHLLLQATSDESALENLTHPPVACLPSSADDFLSLCFNMKLKDDDVRKQRVKMEAQVKRQTQARTHAINGIASRQTKSISLPRS